MSIVSFCFFPHSRFRLPRGSQVLATPNKSDLKLGVAPSCANSACCQNFRSYRMSSSRYFFPALFSAVLLPATLLAAWNDQLQGSPVLEFFPNRIIGATPQTSSVAQDSHGRLFVGSDALLVYDGATWTSHPLPDSYNLTALCFGPDEKLWAGAHNQVALCHRLHHAHNLSLYLPPFVRCPAAFTVQVFSMNCPFPARIDDDNIARRTCC